MNRIRRQSAGNNHPQIIHGGYETKILKFMLKLFQPVLHSLETNETENYRYALDVRKWTNANNQPNQSQQK